ncbi:ABC transporter permease subunit [Thermosipho ferrireducens]|uniref:ABC transporter permease subunit n=1 Tax=Thermosipho ferrireducens TaxID=2571116 RepID=A0ABX7S571_9BACT|nr:carbohydrate ABC transporter permease [Thermosipho ferrireducens]QTA37663.1 ABC transporter permease subunit [Thermosipho ferrireducens]
MRKLIIYLLLSFGFVIMIMPFAWMLVTSFKLPSEVQEWPPKWITKNFFGERDVKVEIKLGGIKTVRGLSLSEALSYSAAAIEDENVLNIIINDDPFYRGTMRIDTTGFKYTNFADKEKFYNWLENLELPETFDTESPEKFFEDVFLYYKSGASPYFSRVEFVSSLTKKLESALKGISLIEKFVDRRIKDENEAVQFKRFLENVKVNLDNVRSDVLKYKAGKELILTDGEIEKILDILKKYDFEYTGSNPLVSVYNTKVVNPVISEKKHVEFYTKVLKYFKTLQTSVVEKPIVARILRKDERIALLKKNLEAFPDKTTLNEVLKSNGFEKLPENYSKKVDALMLEKYNITNTELVNLKTVVVSLKNLLVENKIDYYSIVLNEGFSKLLEISQDKLQNSSTYKIVRAKLNAYSDLNNFEALLKDLILYSEYVERLRKIYVNSMNAWQIIEAPDFVKAIRVRDGNFVEIELDNVSPVYLSDDNLKTIKLKFSFGEIFANVFQNYVDAWNEAPFGRYYWNTFFVATATTILEVIVASMAAYAFSWMVFPGRDLLFGIFLATMMIPGEVLLVPNFITIAKFGWIDTYYALIVPWIVSVFAIFLMRQHFLTIPKELFDASKIDGCSHWRFLWQVVVPLSKPVIITGALLKFVGSWNAFLWVLIVTNSDKYRTLPVGLQNFSSDVGTLYNHLMAAATFSVLPVIILFLFTQQYFVRGIARTGLK